MPETQGVKKAIANFAKRHGLELSQDGTLGERKTKTTVLYAGGRSLSRLLNGNAIHFCRCGSNGDARWIAVLDAETLFRLLEAESLLNLSVERQAAYGRHSRNPQFTNCSERSTEPNPGAFPRGYCLESDSSVDGLSGLAPQRRARQILASVGPIQTCFIVVYRPKTQ